MQYAAPISPDMQEDLIIKLQPKIKAMLHQTTINNRDDLEQELVLMIIKSLADKKIADTPTFFELLEKENEG